MLLRLVPVRVLLVRPLRGSNSGWRDSNHDDARLQRKHSVLGFRICQCLHGESMEIPTSRSRFGLAVVGNDL